ncbi:64R [Yaba monkey tumor virus]|uniref:64R n=1 Tax=Yaba monkey tumor virus (strain VR587) TaxID=928314 RepID=Q6TUU9_YMTV5|nr:64R [Yaba monkey tumor virus]AAR07420.1 64R [Yaba monkey tumor virus]
MESKKNLYFTPVFIEPTLKHSLLNSYKYTFIIFFEIFIVIILMFIFFKTEIIMSFDKVQSINNPIDKLKNTFLFCKENKMMIGGLPNNITTEALSVNKLPIVIDNCEDILMSINGSHKVSLDDIFRRQRFIL